jgi:DNA-directed RNA polymerase alpha subunit
MSLSDMISKYSEERAKKRGFNALKKAQVEKQQLTKKKLGVVESYGRKSEQEVRRMESEY